MTTSPTPSSLIEELNQRFGSININDLQKVLSPVYLPIHSIDKSEIIKRGSFYTVDITIAATEEMSHLTRGSTGKIIPEDFVEGSGTWKEIGKCRIHTVGSEVAQGEFFVKGGQKGHLENTLEKVSGSDYLEIDRYGIAAKLKSALAEQAFANIARDAGYKVTRMPEDIAKHLMTDEGYPNFDFVVEKDGILRRVEVKSLWGTDTSKARLIHSLTKDYETSSCKFETQDIFAVNLWLRTGNIYDFGFAVSEYTKEHPHGLPCATNSEGKLTGYVHQNPQLKIGDGRWSKDLDKIVSLTESDGQDISSDVGRGWEELTSTTADTTSLDQFD